MTRRLMLSYLVVTVFVLLVLEIPLGIFGARLQSERLSSDLQRDAMVLATIYEDALDNDAPYTPEPAMEYSERYGGRVVVVDADGRSIVDTDAPVNRDFSNRPEIQTALAGLAEEPDTRFSQTLGRDILYVAVPVASGGEVHGAVRVTFDPAEVQATVRRYWWRLAAIGAVVLAAVAIVGWIIARSLTRPLTEIRRAAVAAGSGDLSVRIDPGDAPAELRDLAVAFNTTAARLERLIERQRSFVADASHELRTPLTALRLRLENLAEEVPPGGQADLTAAVAESERLGLLVENLLTIARTESGARPLGAVDVVAVVRERCELWAAVAEEQSVRLTTAGLREELVVDVVPGAVEQIIDNLVSNALGVTASGGTVEVAVADRGGAAEIRVIDEGPGMTDEDLARAFDRFWRASHATPGTGLGLAIVQELAEASGGHARLERGAERGIQAVVTLPARSSTAKDGRPPAMT